MSDRCHDVLEPAVLVFQCSRLRPWTRRNSRSLFVTRISFREMACAAMSVSSGREWIRLAFVCGECLLRSAGHETVDEEEKGSRNTKEV